MTTLTSFWTSPEVLTQLEEQDGSIHVQTIAESLILADFVTWREDKYVFVSLRRSTTRGSPGGTSAEPGGSPSYACDRIHSPRLFRPLMGTLSIIQLRYGCSSLYSLVPKPAFNLHASMPVESKPGAQSKYAELCPIIPVQLLHYGNI